MFIVHDNFVQFLAFNEPFDFQIVEIIELVTMNNIKM